MLKHIKLSRFRGFKTLDADLRPVTVVVGRNSSGKTSILYAIRMCIEALAMSSEGDPHLDEDGWITASWGHIVSDHDRLCPVSDWTELFTDKDLRQGSKMRIELSFDESDLVQDIHAEFAYASNSQLAMAVRIRADRVKDQIEEMPKKSKYRKDRLRDLLLPGLPIAMFVPPFYGAPREEEFRSWQLVRRRLGGGDQGRVVRNVVARLSADEIVRLNDFLGRCGVGQLVFRTSTQDADAERHLYVTFRDTNGELELSSAGAGLVNLIALYASMVRFAAPSLPTSSGKRPVVYLLDEPEAHLHPKLQGDIGVALAKMAAEFGAQIIIATHSVEMINRLHQHEHAILLAVERETSTATQLDTNDALLRELGQWCDLTPFASINFLSKKRVLFHEGKTDKEILEYCARLYFRSQPDKLLRFYGFTLVPLNGSGNANAQAVLSALLNPALFPSITSKEPVRAICVLDRDAERKPGFRPSVPAKEGHFQSYTLVWSRHSIESLFIEPTRLVAWLSSVLPVGAVPEATLRKLCEEGIAQVNTDHDLNLNATMERMRFHLRAREQEGVKMQIVAPEAFKLAQDEVFEHPEIWQKGKDRFAKVLGYVRNAISSATVDKGVLENLVYGSIATYLDIKSIDKLGDPAVLIPEEIRALLDEMAK